MSALLTENDKTHIASQIKNIPLNKVDEEMNKLIHIGKTANDFSPRSRIGNNVVDYFTFLQRLETKGKYDINFFEFIERIEEFKRRSSFKPCLPITKK